MDKPQTTSEGPIMADKTLLIERLMELERELHSCGFFEIADMVYHAKKKLKSMRIKKS